MSPERATHAGGPAGHAQATGSNGAPRRVFLYGHPVGHSLSPAMHRAAFRAQGLAARYDAVDVAPAGLAEAVEALRAPDVAGANLTVPHKEAARSLVDAVDGAAQAIGAINTIVHRDGRLVGFNTDGEGFVRALSEAGIPAVDASAVVVGAGGAARAIVPALLAAGAARVAIWNRTGARAQRLVATFEGLGTVAAIPDDRRDAVMRGADLLVNTTSVGMHGGGAEGASPVPADALPERGAVVDIVYRPSRTPLLEQAQARGLTTLNGIGMLLHQGAAAYELWFERPAPVAAMRSALLEAL